MTPTASIRVTYWVGEGEIEGINEFSEDLSANYVANVRGRRAGLGGGLYQLTVQFLSHLTLKEIVTFLLEGMAYDVIKSATTDFLIRPFIDAYRKLKGREGNRRVDIDQLQFVFEDTSILINRLPNTDLLADLSKILLAVTRNFENILKNSQ